MTPQMTQGQTLGGILGNLVPVSFPGRGKFEGFFFHSVYFLFHLFYIGSGRVVEVSGQLVRVWSPFLPNGLNSGCQTWPRDFYQISQNYCSSCVQALKGPHFRVHLHPTSPKTHLHLHRQLVLKSPAPALPMLPLPCPPCSGNVIRPFPGWQPLRTVGLPVQRG